MCVRTVLRSIPSWRAIADTETPCRCNSRIMTSSPSLITAPSLPANRRSIGESVRHPHLPAHVLKGREARNLGNFQTALLGSLHPALIVWGFGRTTPVRASLYRRGTL